LRYNAKAFPLALAKVYGIVFPEDRKLALVAHDAGVDVIMTYWLASAYLLLNLDMPIPGKIDSFLHSTAEGNLSGWKINDEKANALLKGLQEASSSTDVSQVVNDDVEVMSDDEEEEEQMSDVNDVMSVDEEDEDAQVMGDV
jgi:hypothetical protein